MRMSLPKHSATGPFCMLSGYRPRARRDVRARPLMYIDGVFSRVHTKKLS